MNNLHPLVSGSKHNYSNWVNIMHTVVNGEMANQPLPILLLILSLFLTLKTI